MCGIAGIISPSTDQNALLTSVSRMVETINHRGPDGHGVLPFEGGALGHTRLSIVDLSTDASQPMVSTSGRVAIVFNGEIYNHHALRQELVSKGIQFRTKSDTEVLIACYEVWGSSFVERLNGMFAFALHDRSSRKVLLARDRIGIKPLYWRKTNSSVWFGSEIKAIVSAEPTSLDINKDGLLEYLSFQNHLSSQTLFAGIELFPAAHICILNIDDLTARFHRYWSAKIQPLDEDESLIREKLDCSLRDSVFSQMTGDVPVNSFLSGGIDSSAVASLAAQSAGRIKTFTCGFGLAGASTDEQHFDERHLAEAVAGCIGSEHYEAVLNADDFLIRMHDWAWHAEEPRVGSSFPNFCISGLASRFTKVCLSGTGGDEMFAGYPWRYKAAINATDWDTFVDGYHQFWHRMMTTDEFNRLTAPLQPHLFDSRARFRECVQQAHDRVEQSTMPYVDAALVFEMETFLQGLLIVEDKASMAHGLEVRVPLLDNTMIDLALTIPVKHKLRPSKIISEPLHAGNLDTSSKSFFNGKIILRDVLRKYVPSAVAAGPKQGFSPPFETWFRTGLRDWLENEVFSPRSKLSDFLNVHLARSMLAAHFEGRANYRLFIWGMISLHLSITSFMGGRR